MEYKVVFKERFTNHLFNLLTYLESEWGSKVANDFYQRIMLVISRIKIHPNIGAPSTKISGVRGILITKHNRLFYRVQNNTIIVLMLADTRRKTNRY